MRYRSATVLGTATEVAADEKLHALEVLTEHLLPGRWAELRAPRAKELAATSVLRVPLDEWSVKVGDGFPEDPDEDLDEPVWAGVVPMRVAYDDPVDAPDLGPRSRRTCCGATGVDADSHAASRGPGGQSLCRRGPSST